MRRAVRLSRSVAGQPGRSAPLPDRIMGSRQSESLDLTAPQPLPERGLSARELIEMARAARSRMKPEAP